MQNIGVLHNWYIIHVKSSQKYNWYYIIILHSSISSGDPYELDTTRPIKTSQSAGGISTAISDSEDIKNAAEIISDEDDSGSESESEDDYADQAIVTN